MTTDDSSIGDLLRSLSDELTGLVRGELRQAQDEVLAKTRQAGWGAAMLGGAGVLGGLAAGTSAVYVVRVLDKWLPPATAALFATTMYGAGAAALASAGLAELKRVGPPVPEETLASVRKDVDAMRPGTPAPPQAGS